MYTSDNEIRKMLIQVDIDKISDEAAKKLNKILTHFEMELTEDGWYTGTNTHCKSVFTFISKDREIFDCLTKWVFWNPDTNAKEDCIETYTRCLLKWEIT